MQMLFDFFRYNLWYNLHGTGNVIRVVNFQKVNVSYVNIWTKGVCSVDDKTKESMDIFSEDCLQKLNLKKNWIQPCHKYV